MRDLRMQDVFAMSKILKKMNLKDELKVEGKAQDQVGAEIIISIGENLHLAEKEINDLIGSLVGIAGDEFAKLPITEGLEYLEEFRNKPGIADFFKSASRLMK